MNPWKIIGWIVLALLVLFLAFCARVAYRISETQHSSGAAPATPALVAQPEHIVHVVDVSCEQNYSRPKSTVTVRNDGNTTIEFPKAYIQFMRKDGSVASAEDSYLRPHPIQPGSTASATVYSAKGATEIYRCMLDSIQDRDGNPVLIQ